MDYEGLFGIATAAIYHQGLLGITGITGDHCEGWWGIITEDQGWRGIIRLFGDTIDYQAFADMKDD